MKNGSYFACWFRLNQLDQYLIWIYDDPDSVFLDETGRIPVFQTEMDLARYAQSKDIELVNEAPILNNLDAVEEWSKTIYNPIDCSELLGAWNLFTDISYALKEPFLGNRDYNEPRTTARDHVYDKLFYGNNVYGLTPEGTYYVPVWTTEERETLAGIITDGLNLFRRHLSPVPIC